MKSRDSDLVESWERNAERWTRAVRRGHIASRRDATDRAILQAVRRCRPKRLLDAGCGEGWLLRRLAAECDCVTIGIDASAALVAAARQADPAGDYRVLSYDRLGTASDLGGDFDVVVFNFALFAESVAPQLAGAADLLAPGGCVIIQTLHPDSVAPAQGGDGWRCEDFAAFEEPGWQPMPWYQHDRAAWRAAIGEAGLTLRQESEPRAAPTQAPLSLLMTCGRGRWPG